MSEFILSPSLIANETEWTLIDYSGVQQSAMSGAMRTVSRGQRWQARLTFHDKDFDDRAALHGLLAMLRGKSGRCWVADPAYKQRGSFPAPEQLSNPYLLNGAAGYTATTGATLTGFNRTLRMNMNGAAQPALQQSAGYVAGNAYALRVLVADGFNTAGLILGPYLSIGAIYSNRTVGRGLLTTAGVATSSASAQQSPLSILSGALDGQFVLVQYASLRRCALAINPGGVTYLSQLPIDALPVSTQGLLRQGDRVEINGEYKTVTFDLDSNAIGAGTLMFEPGLRKLVPDNSPIHIGEPLFKGVMSVDANQVSRPGGLSDYDVTFMEAS